MYERYCELRDAKGFKDAYIAKELSITPSTFSDWKKGKSVPNTDKLLKICNLLNTTVEYLYTGENPSQIHLSPEETAIITAYRRVNDITKDNICLLLGVKRDSVANYEERMA